MLSFLVVLIVTVTLVEAQVFSQSIVSVNFTGLSDTCLTSLNSSITCDDSLPTSMWDPSVYLDMNQLASLCVSACATSLDEYRDVVAEGCSASDVLVIDDIAYPATYRADEYIYNYQILCRKDATSGEFCASLFDSWSNLTVETSTETCSDCALGVQQLELNSTFGYLSAEAVSFESVTSSCGSTGYSYTSPTPIALNSSATTSAIASATPCSQLYTVEDGDDCNSIAKAQNASTFALLFANHLEAYCADFPSAGAAICLPDQCDVYTVAATDTCRSIVAAAPGSITLTQLSSWNPNINIGCGNIEQLVGSEICISPPGGLVTPVNTASPTNPTTVAAVPTTIANGTNTDCGKYYLVQLGDDCAAVSVQQGIALLDFYFLNPGINDNCTNLIAGESYCIEAVGSISTYTSYGGTGTGNKCLQTGAPSTCFSDLGSYPTAAYWSADASVVGNLTISTIEPIATGTLATCYKYQEYYSLNSTNATFLALEASINSCSYVADSNDIALTDLLSWNPSLSAQNATNCTLIPDYRYCVIKSTSTSATVTSVTSNLNPYLEPSATNSPSDTVSNCNAYGMYYGGDSAYYTCDDFVGQFNITVVQLYAWNPSVGSDCSGFYTGLNATEFRSLCVGVSGTNTLTSTAAAPTQSGIVSNCLTYYTAISGDSCGSIEAAYDITFAQFYAWNPAVQSDCSLLIIGDGYCVSASSASSSSTTSSSTSSASAIAPTQTGIASSCTEYYVTESGDSCATIEAAYGISFAEFYAWNPAVGSNCESLWLDETYCVAAPAQAGISSSCTEYYVTKSGDSCASIESTFSITFAQFYAWNPAVGSDCTSLWLDETYCVAAPSATSTTTTAAAAATPPGPTQTGITSACNAWTIVESGGSCAAIESEYGITFDQFYAWNPAVGASCTNLWVGEAYCVGVSSSSKSRRDSHLALHALHLS